MFTYTIARKLRLSECFDLKISSNIHLQRGMCFRALCVLGKLLIFMFATTNKLGFHKSERMAPYASRSGTLSFKHFGHVHQNYVPP